MLLAIKALRTQFSTRRGIVRAVDDVSLSIETGRTLGLVGESGCGKSVTALSVMQLLGETGRIVGGEVLLEGMDLVKLPRKRLENIRGRAIGMIFQDPMTSLNPMMKIGRQIGEPLVRHLGFSAREARARAIELLEEVRIPRARGRVDDYPQAFSGGMRQRVMIAMALACKPKLLLADEPTTALDVTVQAEIIELLDALRAEHEMAMLIITHNMGVVAELADDVAVMYAGQVVEQAPCAELFERPEHPYTEALLGALPQFDEHGTRHARLQAIPGSPPDLLQPTDTCRFGPRCPYAGDECGKQPQDLREIRPGHYVRSAHPMSARERTPVRVGK